MHWSVLLLTIGLGLSPSVPAEEVPPEMQEMLLLMDLLEEYGEALDFEESGREKDNVEDPADEKDGEKKEPAKPGSEPTG